MYPVSKLLTSCTFMRQALAGNQGRGNYQNAGFSPGGNQGMGGRGIYQNAGFSGGNQGMGVRGSYQNAGFSSANQVIGSRGRYQTDGFFGGNQGIDGPREYAPMGTNYQSDAFNRPIVTPEVQQLFNQVDTNRSGNIDYQELRAALVTNQGRNFSESLCKILICMFDSNNTGSIDIYDFQQLYEFINDWTKSFHQFDRDRSGTIEEWELTQVLQQLGFRFSPEFIRYLVFKFDFEGHARLTMDQFIYLCVQIQRLANIFMQFDVQGSGVISIDYENFLFSALKCSP